MPTTFATTEEIQQYCRMTLRQHGLADYSVVFLPRLTRRLGQANPWEKKVELSLNCLASFRLFSLVLKHEIAHCLCFIENGGTFKVNGRNNFHGKQFKQKCRELNIPHSTKVS
jgi:predicted SprT family Zn-dependent metalloprotease